MSVLGRLPVCTRKLGPPVQRRASQPQDRETNMKRPFLPVVLLLGVDSRSALGQTSTAATHALNPSFSIRQDGPVVEVRHGQTATPVLRFRPGAGFLAAARSEGVIREVVDASGMPRHGQYPLDYCLREKVIQRYTATPQWKLTPKPGGFTIKGGLQGAPGVEYTFTVEAASGHELRFEARVDAPGVNRLYLEFDSSRNEHIFGFGEQFTFLDMKGQRVPLWVMEKGIGRGLEPLTSALHVIGDGGGRYPVPMRPGEELGREIKRESKFGDHSFGTYSPMAYFLSNLGRALVLENTEFAAFDFRKPESAQIELWAARMTGRIFTGATPAEILERYTAYAGRMHRLPAWMVNGLQIGAGGGSASVRQAVDRMLEMYKPYGVPITSVNIHDWQGTRTGDLYIARRLWWTFEPDATLYPDWEQLIKDMRAKGIRLVTYFNNMITADAAAGKPNLRRDLFKQAKDAGYFVRKRDGSPYLVTSGIIRAGIVDLTNPKAREWFKDIMKEQVKIGVAGWMADFAEGLPHDAVLHSGEDAAAYHNRYPVEYAKLNQEVLQEMGVQDEVNFWSRSGYTLSPRYSTGFFNGDQLNSWDEYDGIKTIVNAILSGGLSGVPFYRFSYSGFWSINLKNFFAKLPPETQRKIPADIIPQIRYENSQEHVARRVELATFASYSMIGLPALNTTAASTVSAPDEFFMRFAGIHTELAPYRTRLVSEAAERGLPMVRHLMLHYPSDPEVYKVRYQFLYGPEFLVRPVLDPGVNKVSVYLPAGKWVHLFTQGVYGKAEAGSWVDVAAPIGEPAVFFKQGSPVGEALVKGMRARKIIRQGR